MLVLIHEFVNTFLSTLRMSKQQYLSTTSSLSPLQEAGWELGAGLWLLLAWDSLSGPENHQRWSVWDPCLCPWGPVWICQQNITNVLWKPTAHQVLVLWVIWLLSICFACFLFVYHGSFVLGGEGYKGSLNVQYIDIVHVTVKLSYLLLNCKKIIG